MNKTTKNLFAHLKHWIQQRKGCIMNWALSVSFHSRRAGRSTWITFKPISLGVNSNITAWSLVWALLVSNDPPKIHWLPKSFSIATALFTWSCYAQHILGMWKKKKKHICIYKYKISVVSAEKKIYSFQASTPIPLPLSNTNDQATALLPK